MAGASLVAQMVKNLPAMQTQVWLLGQEDPWERERLSPPQFGSVQSLSRVRLFVTPWIAAHQASLSITNSQSSLRLVSIELMMPSSHLILCHPLLLLPPIPPSIRVFSNESVLPMRWPKYWSFSFSIIPSKEHPGLISFRMDWLDLLAVQGTLKSLLQHHSSKASILQRSAFFTVHLSHPYMTTGKTTALTRQTFVGKVMSLLFNMLSRPTHSIILAWRIPWTKEPGGLQSMRSQRVGHNWASFTSLHAVAIPLVGPTGCHVPTISLSWVHPLLYWQCSLSSTLLFLSQVYILVCDTPTPCHRAHSHWSRAGPKQTCKALEHLITSF